MTYVSNEVTTYKPRPDLSFCDESNNCLSTEVVLNKKIFILTAIYRSPSSNNNTFLKKFENITDKIRNSGYNSILSGDFNYNLINYQYHNDTETFYNVCTSSGYQPAVTKPTRITTTTSTLIDHIWTNYNRRHKVWSPGQIYYDFCPPHGIFWHCPNDQISMASQCL